MLKDSRQEVTFRRGGWTIPLFHHEMKPGSVDELNESLARTAPNFVIGSTLDDLPLDRSVIGTDNQEFPLLIHNRATLDTECHLYDWFRVASAIYSEPDEIEHATANIDLRTVLRLYRNPIIVEVLFSERTAGGVTHDGATQRLIIDLALGLNLRDLRRAIGDFTRGAFVVLPIQHLINQGVSVGQLWRSNDLGVRGVTRLTDFDHARTIEVRLSDIRERNLREAETWSLR